MTRTITVFNMNDECTWWSIRLPDYSQRFIDDFKAQIPPEERNWNSVDKLWSFEHKWKQWAMNLAQRCFPDAEFSEEEY